MLPTWVVAALRWLGEHWAEATTALATGATALFVYLDRRDRMKQQEPYVECAVTPWSDHPGWFVVSITVRNFNPYAIHVSELRVQHPTDSALFADFQIYGKDPDVKGGQKFVATTTPPKLTAPADNSLQPAGTAPSQMFGRFGGHPDELNRRYYLWPGSRRSSKTRLRMSLICEVRSRAVRQQKIPIHRTINASITSKAG